MPEAIPSRLASGLLSELQLRLRRMLQANVMAKHRARRPKHQLVCLEDVPKFSFTHARGFEENPRACLKAQLPANDPDGLDIRVTDEQRERARAFLDDLKVRLSRLGVSLVVPNPRLWRAEMYLQLGGLRARLRLRERSKLVRLKKGKTDNIFDPKVAYAPNGTLQLEAEGSYPHLAWRDSKIPLQERAQAITDEILSMFVGMRDKKLAKEREAAEAAQRRRDERARKAAEAHATEKRDALLKEVSAWKQAGSLREYVAEGQASASTALSDYGEEWIRWALAVADHLDPLEDRLSNLQQTETSGDGSTRP